VTTLAVGNYSCDRRETLAHHDRKIEKAYTPIVNSFPKKKKKKKKKKKTRTEKNSQKHGRDDFRLSYCVNLKTGAKSGRQ